VLDEHVGRYDEAIRRYDEALEQLGGGPGATAVRATLELGRAGVLYRQARYEECVTWAERAAGHAEEAGDREALAHALYLSGGALSDIGRDGIPDLERAIAIYDERGDFVGSARALNNVGVQRYAEGRWDEALAAYKGSREACESGGDVIRAAIAMNNEAEILSDQGRLDEAEPLFEDMVRICRAAGYTLGSLVGVGNLARVAARDGRFDAAQALYEEALAGFEGMGSERFAVETRARIVECCVLAGAHARALELLEGLAEAAAPFVYGGLEAMIERLHGYALCQARRPDEGRVRLDESLRRARDLGATYEEALTLRTIAEISGDEKARAASDGILAGLGVARVPRVPLP
jgi:tetratricopeptide (TPR) repeat protein